MITVIVGIASLAIGFFVGRKGPGAVKSELASTVAEVKSKI